MTCQDKVLAGVDYVTATSRDKKVGLSWYEMFAHLCEAHLGDMWAAQVRDAKRLMYTGRVAEGNLFWGESDTMGYIVIAPGDWARIVWHKVAPTAKSISRLDLATTVQLAAPRTGLAKDMYDTIVSRGETSRKLRVIMEARGGQTLYVGSRQSEQFGRLYDKGAEEGGEPGRKWRYEVQLHKPRALSMASSLYTEWRNDRPYGEQIVNYCHQWFSVRGVRPIFQRVEGAGDVKLETEMKVDGLARKIGWLNAQVAPTVQSLIALGHGPEVFRALGLDVPTLSQYGLWPEGTGQNGNK